MSYYPPYFNHYVITELGSLNDYMHDYMVGRGAKIMKKSDYVYVNDVPQWNHNSVTDILPVVCKFRLHGSFFSSQKLFVTCLLQRILCKWSECFRVRIVHRGIRVVRFCGTLLFWSFLVNLFVPSCGKSEAKGISINIRLEKCGKKKNTNSRFDSTRPAKWTHQKLI